MEEYFLISVFKVFLEHYKHSKTLQLIDETSLNKKIIEYSESTINAYSPSHMNYRSHMNLISWIHNYVREESVHLWYFGSTQ